MLKMFKSKENTLFPTLTLNSKWIILSAFILANAALMVSLRSATVFSDPDARDAVASTEVLASEAVKLLLALTMSFIFDARMQIGDFIKLLNESMLEDSSDFVKLSVPAILYIIQNNLQYVIETRIVFLVLYQFKIITTAFFFSNMLPRRIYFREWCTIIALAFGVCVVEACQPDVDGHYHASYPYGIVSVLIAILTSGFAGVYYEKIMKSSKWSM